MAIRFDPEIGDRYRFVSDVTTSVVREIDGVTERSQETARLVADESVVAVDDDEVTVEVTVTRDANAPRTFEVRLDRASRLTAIDLIEGVPAAALGIDVGADVPSDVASPPEGPLEPGMRWQVEAPAPGGVDARSITGHGRIRALGVEDDVEVAIAEVSLVVPIRSVVTTADGRVTIVGEQTIESETAYDLADGAARRDTTTIDGSVTLIVEPPLGVEAAPVEGTVDYEITTSTRRVGTDE